MAFRELTQDELTQETKEGRIIHIHLTIHPSPLQSCTVLLVLYIRVRADITGHIPCVEYLLHIIHPPIYLSIPLNQLAVMYCTRFQQQSLV